MAVNKNIFEDAIAYLAVASEMAEKSFGNAKEAISKEVEIKKLELQKNKLYENIGKHVCENNGIPEGIVNEVKEIEKKIEELKN